ncbi:alpha/beta-hydrolase [Rickenella mellea]|uniref:Alpha/beta-hydrolase n=1 Tax=Rickenella mellea TaxID=50990 RepID=A0A4Y7PQF1_9AGAM|nr:alpha/beta-hydrolase [Rickenella mellea]
MHLLHENYVLDPDEQYSLHVTAKRYWTAASDTQKYHPDALTLIFLHSTSFHKETWEPCLERFFTSVASGKDGAPIQEAWAIECPNHGASAELNEAVLRLPEFIDDFTCEKYAFAVHRFLLAGTNKGAKVDFKSRRLIGVGHSLGGVAMTILQYLQPNIKFRSIILIEPMLSPNGPDHLLPLRKELIRGAYERRDVWPTRQSAFENLKRRKRTETWHPSILEVYVKHGLRDHPGSRFKDAPYGGVTLSCTREQEAAMYRDAFGPTKPVFDLNKACNEMPVHLILGKVNDFIPRIVQEALIEPTSPRKFASISWLEGTGHLIPQESPDALAKLLARLLCVRKNLESTSKNSRHKL